MTEVTDQEHVLQYASLPCPSLSPRVCSNSCPLSWWCYLTTSSSAAPFSSCPQSFSASGLPSFRVFSNELALQIRWPKYWSISFINDPSNEYSGLISFRIDWLDLLIQVQGSPRNSQESSPTPQFKSINSSVLSFICSSTLTSIPDYWKNHSFDQTDLCWQTNVFAF